MANAEGFEGPDYGMGEAGWDSLFGAVMHSGVAPDAANSMQVYTDSDGAQVKIRPGVSLIRGARKVWDSSTPLTISIQPNFSGQYRTDLVVHRKNPQTKDIELAVLQGAPSANPNPLAPSCTRVAGGIWEEPLAIVGIPIGFARPGGPGSIQPNFISDVRTVACSGNPTDIGRPIFHPSPVLPAFGFGVLDAVPRRRDFYPRLYTAYQNTWGNGDGSTTFGFPDGRGRMPRGVDGSFVPGNLIGGDFGALTNVNQLPNGVALTSPNAEAHYMPPTPGPGGNIQMTYVSGGSQPIDVRNKAFIGYWIVRYC